MKPRHGMNRYTFMSSSFYDLLVFAETCETKHYSSPHRCTKHGKRFELFVS